MTGLQFQSITVQTDGGYNDGEDDFASDQPHNQNIVNARFDETQQIAKRFGTLKRTQVYTGSYGPPHSIVDVDGIPTVIGGNGTAHYDTIRNTFTFLSPGAPQHAFVRAGPIVRGNNQTRRPDCAVYYDANILCETWEDSLTSYAYYQFFQLVGDDNNPVALTEPRTWSGGRYFKWNVHIVTVGKSFVAFGYDSNNDLCVSAYDTSAGNYIFSPPSYVDSLFRDGGFFPAFDYAVCIDRVGNNLCHIAYRANQFFTRAKSFDAAGINVSTKNLFDFGEVSHKCLTLFHHKQNAELIIGHDDGTVTHYSDTYSTLGTNVLLIGSPTGSFYLTQDFQRAMVTQDTGGDVWYARSTADVSGLGQNPVGGVSQGGLTQIVKTNSSYTKYANYSVLPSVVLVSHGGYLPDINKPTFIVANQQANITKNYNSTLYPQTGFSYVASPVAHIVHPLSIINAKGSIEFIVVQAGRCLQDFIGTQENSNPSSKFIRNFHMSQINSTAVDQKMFWTAPVIVSNFEITPGFGASSTLTGYKYGADLVRFQVGNVPAVRDVQSSGIRLLGGGSGCTMLDGVRATQNTPDVPSVVRMNTVETDLIFNTDQFGGNIGKFRIVQRFIDSKGNIHRSSPSSIVVTGDFPGITSGSFGNRQPYRLEFTAPYPSGLLGDGTLNTLKQEVEVYGISGSSSNTARLLGVVEPQKSPDDEGLMYVVVTPAGTCPTSFSITTNTGNRTFNELPELYTDSGELGAWPTPPLIDIVSTQSRLWGISAERRLDVWYTKPIIEGFAPEFSTNLITTIPQEGGDCVALAALDDKVIVFKERKIYYLFGDPGDSHGNNSSLQKAILLSGDVGCVNAQSVVEGPFGVLFLSERGFMKVDRGLNLSFIGLDIKNYQDPASGGVPFVVTNGTLVPSVSEVRWTVYGKIPPTPPVPPADVVLIDDLNNIFTTEDGVTNLLLSPDYQAFVSGTTSVELQDSLVYNYRLSKWSKNTNIGATDACVSNGIYQFIRRDGSAIYETPNSWNFFSTDKTPVNPPFQITTSWIKFAQLANYKRINAIVVTLRWFTGGITVRSRTDYQNNYETTKVWSESNLNALVDPSTRRVQLVILPTKQKCEAIQLEINEDITSGTIGRAFELIGLQMKVGLKKGNFKRLPKEARK